MDQYHLQVLGLLHPEIAGDFSSSKLPEDDISGDTALMVLALMECMKALAANSPFVFVLEDWHHIDDSTLNFLSALSLEIAALNIVLIGTARSNELRMRDDVWPQVLAFDRSSSFNSISLERLTQEEADHLMENLLGKNHFYHDLPARIFAHSQGNPLFIIETLKELIESQRLVLDSHDKWSLADEGPIDIPDVIQQVISSRLGKLPSKDRQLIDMAALLGDPFDYELLADAIGWGSADLLLHSNNLLQRQLIIETSSGYKFVHELFRQATYDLLMEEELRHMHAEAGRALENFDPSQFGELARHFRAAGEYELALPYCIQAGQHAESIFAHRFALNYYDWAILSAAQISSAKAKLVICQAAERRGVIFGFIGEFDQALECFREMLSAAEQSNDTRSIALANKRIGWTIGERLGDRKRGLEKIQYALDLAIQIDDTSLIAWIKADLGALYNMIGDHERSINYLEEALGSFRKLSEPEGEATCLQFLAVVFHFISQHKRALSHYQQALEIWRSMDKKRETAKTLNDIGYLCLSNAWYRSFASLPPFWNALPRSLGGSRNNRKRTRAKEPLYTIVAVFTSSNGLLGTWQNRSSHRILR